MRNLADPTEFLEVFLLPAFKNAYSSGEEIIIDLEGICGCSTFKNLSFEVVFNLTYKQAKEALKKLLRDIEEHEENVCRKPGRNTL